MKKFEIPSQILNLYDKTGVLAIGECHGIVENYKFYNLILDNLPNKPNLALELGHLDKKEFENYLAGRNVENPKVSRDGRVNYELFSFLKNYLTHNPNTEFIFLDDFDFEEGQARDQQMAKHFLKNIKKPILIISGNIHTKKDVLNYAERTIIPMGYFIKNEIGDFPVINIRAASGSFFNFELKTITPDEENKDKIGIFTDLGNNNFDYYIEKATPTTPLS